MLFFAFVITLLFFSTGSIFILEYHGIPPAILKLLFYLTVFGIFFIAPIREILYFRYYFYDLTDKHIIIKKGIVSRNEATISYDRIQNILVDQDFWDRIFKLYDVHIATADYQSAKIAHLDGVSKENSERLKASLLENVAKAGSNRSV